MRTLPSGVEEAPEVPELLELEVPELLELEVPELLELEVPGGAWSSCWSFGGA